MIRLALKQAKFGLILILLCQRVDAQELRTFSAVKSETRSVEELNHSAVEKILIGKEKEGLEILEKAKELDPRNSKVLFNLSGIYLNQNDYEKSLQEIDSAIETSPSDLSLLYRKAEILFAKQEMELAVSTYEKIASIDPSYELTVLRLGSLYASLGKIDLAEKSLRQAAKLDPNSFLALSNLGNVLIMQKNYLDATSIFKKAHEIKETAQSCMSYGVALEAIGKIKHAQQSYQRAIELGYKDPKLEEHLNQLQKKLQN